MRITLQYFDGCPNWEILDRRIAEAVDGRSDAEVVHQRVETPEDALRVGFHGSPTVLVDGVDPFADGSAPVGLACRMFRTPDGMAGSPTVEQLRTAIREAARGVRESTLQGLPNAVPIACTLAPDAGEEQVERWRAFDDDHLLDVERGDARIILHYAKADDSVRRLHDLVAVESACCSFVDWVIDESHADLRLVVTGTAEQLAALDIGRGTA
jgi:hypothetical protein